jgi:hypothetical protein
MSYKDTLATLKTSMLAEMEKDAIALLADQPDALEMSLTTVISAAERMGTMPHSLVNFQDPLAILERKDERGEFSLYSYIIG